MAWRPNAQLIAGELDNTERNLITGWMTFRGIKGRVTFRLTGNFLSDIAGCRIRLRNPDPSGDESYMRGFGKVQRGEAGDITAGRPPKPYVGYPYIEWYSQKNGRVVIELDPSQIKIVSGPVWQPEEAHDAEQREVSRAQFGGFLQDLSRANGAPAVAIDARKHGAPPELVN